MFRLFKKKNESLFPGYEKIATMIFDQLPSTFVSIKNQIDEGLLMGLKTTELGKIRFSLKTNILNKYEEKDQDCYEIKGVKVNDIISNMSINLSCVVAYNIFLGLNYSGNQLLSPNDISIDTSNYYIKSFDNREFDALRNNIVDPNLNLINPNDVYMVELEDKKYYHLKDLADGDFIGIDESGIFFRITHDPFEITEIHSSFLELLAS